MAQTPQKQDFEPWLKPINYWTLSHGSNPQKMDLRAMAQTHIWHADFHMVILMLFFGMEKGFLIPNEPFEIEYVILVGVS